MRIYVGTDILLAMKKDIPQLILPGTSQCLYQFTAKQMRICRQGREYHFFQSGQVAVFIGIYRSKRMFGKLFHSFCYFIAHRESGLHEKVLLHYDETGAIFPCQRHICPFAVSQEIYIYRRVESQAFAAGCQPQFTFVHL